ncbi:hypothetical protein BC939DRAFT_88672 [Gamsiella multidivaricata]|uniref:uncharacterized protein n=1 Tax=Gamsiella multidivaricata TaxID=101098 RepID=UPI0022208392|nr:uncharacterized protein BC939DRAFT_88672 [Gamsiella multidivaricata]KAI7815770.1 hypothetical protein BC939DRAFT_88672 [Gamsiella multidivaricata]
MSNRQNPKQVSDGYGPMFSQTKNTRDAGKTPRTPSPEPVPKGDDLIQLTGDFDKITISDNNRPGNSRQSDTQGRPLYVPDTWLFAGIPAEAEERYNHNGLPLCQGLVASNELCKRDGINEMFGVAGVEYYCHQHDPQKRHKQCHAFVKREKGKERRRCKMICSDSELRDGGRFICNRHFNFGAVLIAI